VKGRDKMKAGQFSNEQVVAILQEAEKGEKPILEICREKGISEATFYAWRKKFGGMSTKDITRLRELEKENARLKRLLAERDLENDVLKEALAKNF
jgi:putative transposase